MLPPVDDAVLQNNPEFATLYNTLTTAVLNANGTTKTDAAAKDREAVRQKLKSHRLKAARHHLVVQAISSAAVPRTDDGDSGSSSTRPATIAAHRRPNGNGSRRPTGTTTTTTTTSGRDEHPSELLDLLVLLPPLLDSTLAEDSEDGRLLLSSRPFSSLPALLPQLSVLVSDGLRASAVEVARVANPTTNPSFLHRSVSALPAHVASLSRAVEDGKASVATARLSASSALAALLAAHALALAALLRALEAKHGAVGRSLELRAADVALAARAAESDARVAHSAAHAAVYTPDATAALANYTSHLRDAKLRLADAVRNAQTHLREYGVAVDPDERSEDDDDSELHDPGHRQGSSGGHQKERTMVEMARVYRDMGKQVADARADLERLGRAA